MSKKDVQEPYRVELLLVSALVEPKENDTPTVTFGSQSAEKILTTMCKEDEQSWELVKKVIFDTLDKIETACGYKLNDDGTEVTRPE